MLACTLHKSIITEAKLLAVVSVTLFAMGQKGLAQTVVSRPTTIPAVTVTSYQPPGPAVVADPNPNYQVPVYAPSPVYVRQAAPGSGVRRSSPPSMSRSSFSERWRADLKASGRGHRP